MLDQILVSDSLLTNFPIDYDPVHVNAEFADQASDHDPPGRAARLRGRPTPSQSRIRWGARPGSPHRSLRELSRAGLTDHGHLDLPGILELLLDVPGDLVREEDGAVVVDLARLDDHADLPAGLKRVDLLDAVLARGDLLQGLEPLDVVLERVAPGPGLEPEIASAAISSTASTVCGCTS